jgi:hypothetical protein
MMPIIALESSTTNTPIERFRAMARLYRPRYVSLQERKTPPKNRLARFTPMHDGSTSAGKSRGGIVLLSVEQ